MLLAFGLAPGAARAAEVEGVKLADSARLETFEELSAL